MRRIQWAVRAGMILFLASGARSYGQATVSIEKELFITDLAVVNHPAEAMSENGAFHIRTLLEAMAPTGKGAKDVMLSILGSWRDTSNPDLPARDIDGTIINPWKRWKPGAASPSPETDPLPGDADWQVNWQKAPFRLLAIVNRIDLHKNPKIGNAGEGRFVFGLTDPLTGGPLQFTLILEYIQPAGSDFAIRQVAADWHALGQHPAFNDGYVNALKTVTGKFSGRNAAPGRINGSAISQIRSNEVALAAPWELREFALAAPDSLPHPTTVKLTPHHALNDTMALSFMMRRLGPNVSEALPESTFDLRALTNSSDSFDWKAPGFAETDAILRRFSVNTCNGCHGGDGKTGPDTPFLHVAPRAHGAAAKLSRFLSGTPPLTGIIDPGTGGPMTKNDLEARKTLFEQLIGVPLPVAADARAELQAEEIERSVRVH